MNRLRACCSLIFICTLSLAAPAAGADDSAPLAQMATFLSHHGYGASPLIDDGNLQDIKIQVNGHDALFAVNTMLPTMLTIHRAHSWHLEIKDSGEKFWWLDGASKKTMGTVQVSSFTINTFEVNRVNPIPLFPAPTSEEWGDGNFGYDYLHMNSAVLMVAGRILFFKPGKGPAANAAEYLTAMGLKPIPFTYGSAGIRVPGTLDGHAFTAVVASDFITASGQLSRYDSGSTFSNSYLKGIGEETFKTYDRLIYDTGAILNVYHFRPTTLQFGPVTIEPMEIGAFDSDYFTHSGCDFILGRDILTKHGAVVDFGNNTLWMKP